MAVRYRADNPMLACRRDDREGIQAAYEQATWDRRSLDDELDFAIASSTQETKKPVPAPPPRRGHGRTDTKTNISNSQTTPAAPRKSSEEDLPDSTSPPPDNSRQAPPAPAPPPPRRPHVSNRPVSLQPGLSLPASTGGASNASPTTPQFDSSAQQQRIQRF